VLPPSPDRSEALPGLFSDLLAGLPSGVVAYRLEEPGEVGDLRVMYLNDAAAQLLRVEDTSLLLGHLVRDVDPLMDQNPAYPVLLRVIATGEGEDIGRVPIEDETIGHVVFAARAFPLPAPYVGVMFEDVTEQALLEERVSQQQEEFRTLAGATFEGVGLVADGRFVVVNEALSHLLGQPAEALVGRPADLDVGLPELPAELDDQRHAVEAELRRPDGGTLPVELRTRRVRFGGQDARAIVVRDITERVRALEALNRQALRFRAIFDATFQLIGLMRPDGTLVEANQTALEFGGLEADDVIGRPLWETYWWSHSPRAQKRVRDAVARAASGELVRYNERVRGANDTRVVIDFTLKPVFDGDEVVLLIPEGRDISDTIRAQRALRRQQRRTARILNAAGEGILGVNAEGVVTFVNEAARVLLDAPSDALVGRPHAEVFRPTDEAGAVPEELPMDRVLRRGRAEAGAEGYLSGPGGTRFPAEYVVTPLAEDGAKGAVIVFRDVTERRTAEAALRASEERYRTLVGALHEGVVLQGRDGAILASNLAAEQILGLTADQMAGRSSLDSRWRVITPDGEPLPGDQHPAMVALRTGEPVHDFVQGVHKPDGELRWILVNSSLIWGDDPSEPEAVVSTFYDITEQREAEEALRRSELRSRTTLSTLSEAVILSDAEGNLLEANPAARVLLDIPEDAYPNLLAEGGWDVFDEGGAPFPARDMPIAHVVRTGEPVRGVIQEVRFPDGRRMWVSVNAQPVADHPGAAPHAVVASVVDITERRRAEQALREREAQLRQAQQIAHVGDWYWEPASGTIEWSDELYRIFGHAPQAFAPTFEEYLSQVHPEDRESVREQIGEALAERRAYEVVHRILRPDGEVRHVYGRGEVIFDDRGEVSSFQGTAQDTTEQERNRQALQRYARELEGRNAELEQFAYVASHDLQEPLRMVSSFLQLLQRRYAGRLDDTADEYIGFAVDGAKRMQALIQDLLAYSRVGSRGKPFQRVDLARVMEDVLTDLGPAIRETEARVEVDGLPAIDADPTQMRQLLQNLVGNALKFRGPEPPVVHVRAMRGPAFGTGPGEWRISVNDNGIGIAPEHRERIFQIFQRLHTRDEYDGTGIGLAICKRIVERHGGRIWVDTADEGGAAFHFTLPRPRSASDA